MKENQNEEKEAEERPEKVAKKDELQTQITSDGRNIALKCIGSTGYVLL